MWVVLNGELIVEEQAKISIWDRGFLLGDGVFETLKYSEYGIEFFEEHFERLKNSCEVTGINLPYSASDLNHLIMNLVAKNDLAEAAIRLTLSRGVSGPGLSTPADIKPTLLITATPVPNLKEMKARGVKVITYVDPNGSVSNELGPVKATNYLINIMAKRYAESQGVDEALFVDESQNILELTTANIFFIEGGVVKTPPLIGGILPGVTRKNLVIGLEDEKTPLLVGKLNLKDLNRIDEAFMCSSVRGIVPISEINGVKFKIKGDLYLKCEEVLEKMKKK